MKRLLETVTVFREEDVNRLFVQPSAVVWSKQLGYYCEVSGGLSCWRQGAFLKDKIYQ